MLNGAKREKHEAEALCRPLNIWRTQWSEKKYREMRVTANQKVKISIIKMMLWSL